ncbi:MAG: uroporphyrinogen-III synthase, partial [Pseudomonadota bacterium]
MKVLVTRAEPAASSSATKLQHHGFEPVVYPLFEVADTFAVMPDRHYDGIVFTSANGPRILAERNYIPSDTVIPVFCVGDETKKAAEALGFTNLVSANGGGAALAELIGKTEEFRGKTFLYPAAKVRSFDMVSALLEYGIGLELVSLYEIRKIAVSKPDFKASLVKLGPGAVFHYSVESAKHFMDMIIGTESKNDLRHLIAINISQKTADMLDENDWRV